MNEDEFITQHCFTGYRPIKGFNPIYSQALYMKSSFDGIAYRYAETLLINAEAKAELNTITNADLDRTVNQLRDRVGMPHLTVNVGFTDPKWPDWGYSLSPVLQEIRRERCIELAGEGFRFNDLKRWKAGKLLNNVLTYVGKRKPDGNLAIVYPNYTNPDLSYQAGKAVLGRTRCTFIRFRQENFREIRNCYHRIRDGRCSNNRFPSCDLD